MYIKMHIEDEFNSMISDINSIKMATYCTNYKNKLEEDDKVIY